MRPRHPAAVLLLAAALVGCGSQVSPGAGPAGAGGRWTRVADSPLGPRETVTMVWTGDEVLVLGGDTSPCPPNADCAAPADTPRDVAAYDPAADTWRTVAPLPYSPHWPRAVSTGDAVYVLDGGAGQPVRFLAWTKATDEWQELPAPPGEPYGLTAVGDRVVAYQTTYENGATQDSVFDPAGQAWTPLPEPPGTPGYDRSVVELDDHSLALLDIELVPNPGAAGPTLYRAAVLDLDTSRWRRLPGSDVAGYGGGWHQVGDLLVNASTQTVDGGEVGNYGRDVPTGGILDPAAGTWSPLPERGDAELGPAVGDVAGDDVVVSGGWALHVADGRWERLPDLDRLVGVSGQSSVWAGDRLMVWGGARFDGSTPNGELIGTGWTWRPSTEETTMSSADADDSHNGPAWRLVGSWQLSVDGPGDGDVLRLSAGGLALWQECGTLDGSWRADRDGVFVASLFGGSGDCISDRLPSLPWLDAAVGWRRHRDGINLLDDDGQVVAWLRPGGRPTPGPDILASEADPPVLTDAERAGFPGHAPALPAGATPADAATLVGRWVPVEDDGIRRPDQPYVELRADGSYQGSDGCNGSMGRWVSGPDGAVLATSGAMTLVGCHNLYVTGYLVDAHAAGFVDGVLVLVADDGTETGRLRRGE